VALSRTVEAALVTSVSIHPYSSDLKLTFKPGFDSTEYVDGGLYTTETPGSDGKGWSAGRGGAGNVKKPLKDSQIHYSDRQDNINEESIVPIPKEGEGYSTGRGGVANVHPQGHPEKKSGNETSTKNSANELSFAYVTTTYYAYE
jgi:Protein of unknown function (DUF3602)